MKRWTYYRNTFQPPHTRKKPRTFCFKLCLYWSILM
uniref:Uncharacterized protein n=1 Tax=Arundo donax TaxID=35708 RepID=A0A0A8YMQ0_ARUDO